MAMATTSSTRMSFCQALILAQLTMALTIGSPTNDQIRPSQSATMVSRQVSTTHHFWSLSKNRTMPFDECMPLTKSIVRDVSTEEKWFLQFTPIALLFVSNSQWKVDSDESARGRLVAYWLDDEETLHRSWSVVDSKGSVNFSPPSKAGGKANKATKFGQLSVLYDPKGKKNVIHCHPQSANHNASVQIYSDAWSGF